MALEPPEIDPDLARAATLPARWYWAPEALVREQEAVFARTWQLATGLEALRKPGDYLRVEVAGEPLLVLRDDQGRLRALSAVCRHRARPVATGSGNRRSFRCGYHGWTYALDGRLLAAPEFDGVLGFDPARVRLPEQRVESWGPFAFVNLDPAAPALADWMAEVVASGSDLSLEGLRSVERRDYRVGCNWKVYVDNYLEGYHIPIVHPGLFRELDYAAYRVETHENVSLQIAPMRKGGGDRRYRATPRTK